VGVDVGDVQLPGPLNLVLEGLHRQAEDLLVWGGEVDEIDRMDDGVLDVSALAALEELLGVVRESGLIFQLRAL
jgi:hypothetical protein